VTKTEYDPTSGLVEKIELTYAGTLVRSYAYRYYPSLLLRTRTEASAGVSETFKYDGLNRLERWKSGGEGAWSVTYAYDDLGNLTGRTYRPADGDGEDLAFEHSRMNAGPHAVTRSPWGSYGYDARGNRTATPTGSISYTPFDLPREIKNLSGAVTARILYDADNRRALKDEPQASRRTFYADGLYELRKAGASETHVFYVVADGRAVAQVERQGASTWQDVLYLNGDHLGTVDVVTGRTAMGFESLSSVRRLDPFGNEVSLTSPSLLGRTARPLLTVRRGFTRHEEDFELGLVNMAGRIYEPRTARFLSVDPIVTEGTGQALNRYSYVHNNPVNAIDPSGFAPVLLTAGLIAHDPTAAGVDAVTGADPVIKKGDPVSGPFSTSSDHDGSPTGATAGPAAKGHGRELAPSKPEGLLHLMECVLLGCGAANAPAPGGDVIKSRTLKDDLGDTTVLIGSLRGGPKKAPAPPGKSGAPGEATAAQGGAPGGAAKEGADLIGRYLGPGARASRNKAGDLVVESADGAKKVRFDIKRPAPHSNPHAHVEEFTTVKNKSVPTYKSGPIYPKDVPHE
jgi:RHS repeat-associated protein